MYAEIRLSTFLVLDLLISLCYHMEHNDFWILNYNQNKCKVIDESQKYKKKTGRKQILNDLTLTVSTRWFTYCFIFVLLRAISFEMWMICMFYGGYIDARIGAFKFLQL